MTAPARSDRGRQAGTVLFAGGGTAGHVFPALAVAEELSDRGWAVRFAGAAGGMEERLVGERGWPFSALPARPLVGRGPLARARALATTARSTLAARRLVRSGGVAAVVGTGGYVSAPAVLGARLAGRKALLVEPNAEAGLANRWLSRWAAGAAVAHTETGRRLHCPSWVTGVPVRGEFFAIRPPEPAAPAAAAPLRLLVLGGSRGARQLNLEVPRALGSLLADGSLAAVTVLHQAGRERVAEARDAYAAAGLPTTTAETEAGPSEIPTGEIPAGGTGPGIGIEVTGFLGEVAAAMAASDLIVSRAGAITSAEICAAGRASLLVPLAIAAGHQAANADRLAAAGAAVVVPAAAAGDELATALGGLLSGGRERLAAMGRAARGLAREGAAAAIADRVEDLARGGGSGGDDGDGDGERRAAA